MNSQTIRILYILLLVLTQSACSNRYHILDPNTSKPSSSLKIQDNFLDSGSITLSYPLNHNKLSSIPVNITDKKTHAFNSSSEQSGSYLRYAPIIGFFPPVASFNPADNELWIEIDSSTSELKVFKGKEQIKAVKGEGEISLAPGEYPLQHKQKDPLWYAHDEYFEKRHLKIPPRGDNFRYRRGALGNYAIYPTTSFPIHSGPFWSEEVGGFKISETDLASIFTMIQPGTPVIVK